MPNVTVIPTAFARRSAEAMLNPRNADTCGIHHIAGRLGQAHRTAPYICRTIDALIASEDFPAPLPLVRGGTVLKTAHKDSRWPVVAVDAWFDDRLPPSARAAIGQAERVEVDSRLNANLAGLFADQVA